MEYEKFPIGSKNAIIKQSTDYTSSIYLKQVIAVQFLIQKIEPFKNNK